MERPVVQHDERVPMPRTSSFPGMPVWQAGFLTLAATLGSPSGRPYGVGFIFTKQAFRYGYWESKGKNAREWQRHVASVLVER